MGEDKYMAISVNYRGSIKSKEANATVQWLKQNNKISFVEWCPTGFKIGLNEVPAAKIDDDIMAPAERNVTMIGNNAPSSTGMSVRVWKRASSLRPARTLASSRRTTWMWSRNKRRTRSTRTRNSKLP